MNKLIVVSKNIKLKKVAGIDEIPPEFGKQVYSTHIYLYSATNYITKPLLMYGEKVVYFRPQKKKIYLNVHDGCRVTQCLEKSVSKS